MGFLRTLEHPADDQTKVDVNKKTLKVNLTFNHSARLFLCHEANSLKEVFLIYKVTFSSVFNLRNGICFIMYLSE